MLAEPELPTPRYTIDGKGYISVTQLLKFDPDHHRGIQTWIDDHAAPEDAHLHTFRRSLIGTTIHWKIQRWFQKRMNMPADKEIGYSSEDRSISYKDFTEDMKAAIEVIWSYFVEWAEKETDAGNLRPVYIEKKVWHDGYHYAGTADFFGYYKGDWCIIDWKTAKMIHRSHIYASQLCAYERAAMNQGITDKKFDKLYIVRFNEKTSGPDIHPCVRDWGRFKACIDRYQAAKDKQNRGKNGNHSKK